MVKKISARQRVTVTELRHEFRWWDDPQAGFSFDLDKDGKFEDNPLGGHNYYLCLTGQLNVDDEGVQEWTHSYVEPAVIECSCKRHVALDGFTNTCECGADYNMDGTRLAPRSQWGEETGESVSDILSIDSGDFEMIDRGW